jgi:hypothetical protein
LFWLLLILLFNPAFGQKIKSKREPAPAIQMEIEQIITKPKVNSKPWFDNWADYKKYLTDEPCIHKILYERYMQ